MGADYEIIFATATKSSAAQGLGLSLEGTVDVEDGKELHPHHYIRSMQNDGLIGRLGIFKPGDELLEANGVHLFGRNHVDVVQILRDLVGEIFLVCGRNRFGIPGKKFKLFYLFHFLTILLHNLAYFKLASLLLAS